MVFFAAKPPCSTVRLYALALKSLPQDQQNGIITDLKRFLGLFNTRSTLWSFVCFGLSRHTRHQLIQQLKKSVGIQNPASVAFINLLAKKKRLNLIPDLLEFSSAKDLTTVRVVTAEPLTEKQKKEYGIIVDALRVISRKDIPEKLFVENEINPDILGGAVIIYKTLVVDASLKRSLQNFLQQAESIEDIYLQPEEIPCH